MMKHRIPWSRGTAGLHGAVAMVLFGLTLAGCSSEDPASPASGGKGGSSGDAGSEAKGGGVQAGSPATGGGGNPATGGSGGNGSGGTSPETGGTDVGNTGGDEATGFANPGLLRQSGKATVTATDYVGTEEYHVVSEGGLGSDVCDVKFDVKRVGDAPASCPDCDWSHLVELSNPEVIVDESGACSANDCEPIAAGPSKLDGRRVALGFSKKTGHGDQLMHYDEAKAMWVPLGRGNWDSSGALGYTISGSLCSYGH